MEWFKPSASSLGVASRKGPLSPIAALSRCLEQWRFLAQGLAQDAANNGIWMNVGQQD